MLGCVCVQIDTSYRDERLNILIIMMVVCAINIQLMVYKMDMYHKDNLN
jgi:hypothetical protein